MESSPYPTFSIAIETANLAQAEISDLRACLASLARQDPSPAAANEVLLLDDGGRPDGLARELREEHPWLAVHRVQGENYTGMKVRAAQLATGDVVVLCDSDCRYEAGWLAGLLEPFRAEPGIGVVGGETSTPIKGPYGLAMALMFVFPPFTSDVTLVRSGVYWANNAAIRRELLLRFPLPEHLPLYRGQNIVHSMGIGALGEAIWRQPKARALHVLPSLPELPRRFFRMGRDAVAIAGLACDASGRPYCGAMEPDPQRPGRLRKLARRARLVLSEDPRRAVFLPPALLVLTVAAGAYLAGAVTAGRRQRSPQPALSPQP